MWLIHLLFALSCLLIWWSYSGYLIWLYLVGSSRDRRDEPSPECLPPFTVIVCCLNEAKLIGQKMLNLAALRYPRDRLRIILVDGGSTDGTPLIARQSARGAGLDIEIHSCGQPGKCRQINCALELALTEFIVVTDADAVLSTNALIGMAAELVSDEGVGVVGALSRPGDCTADEAAFWDSQNRVRLLECRAFSSSIVVGPCYAFRRSLLARFPEDVLADDVFVSFMAASHGFRTVYRSDLRAVELRSARTIAEFCCHKFRKSNGLVTESLRFLYRLPSMENKFKVIFLTRIFQLFGVPPLLIFGTLIAGVLLQAGEWWAIAVAVAAMIFSLATTRYILSRFPLEEGQYSILTVAKVFVLSNLILLTVSLVFPFRRQNSARLPLVRLSGSQKVSSGWMFFKRVCGACLRSRNDLRGDEFRDG